jgi:2-C-methyl-D-erythritol 4-phosphate cytidylyltransferase
VSAHWCVVPAAGRGRRFGGDVPKQYLRIGDKPLVLHTLERLAAHPRVAGFMLVLAPDDEAWTRGLIEVLGKPLLVANGGNERADSVLAGLRALPASVAAEHFVLVHDAARPCVRADDVTRLVEHGTAAGGGLLAAPLRDTLKRSDADGRSSGTEPRESRWRALTPQLFRRGELEVALAAALADGVAITDEAMAMERAGHAPLLIEGAEDNIKVTTPADLALAEFLLGRG